MEQILNNIKKIEYIEARYLKNITIIHGRGVMLNMWRNFQTVEISELASATSTSKIVGKNTIYTVKLSAHLVEDFNPDNRHLCYRLTTVTGGQFLIGTNTKPYSITTISDNFPSSVTDKSGRILNAEYSNTFGILAILDA